MHDELGGLGLACHRHQHREHITAHLKRTCTTLAGNDDHLVTALLECAVRLVGNGVDVWGQLVQIATSILANLLRRVNAELLVRVQRYQHIANVRLQEIASIARAHQRGHGANVDEIGAESLLEIIQQLLFRDGVEQHTVANTNCFGEDGHAALEARGLSGRCLPLQSVSVQRAQTSSNVKGGTPS